jgi:hypothetical protein
MENYQVGDAENWDQTGVNDFQTEILGLVVNVGGVVTLARKGLHFSF